MLRKVEGSVYIRAPRKLVYAVLTEYDVYRDWNPEITNSRMLACEGGVSIVELISPPLGRGKLILEFVVSPEKWLIFNQTDRYREDGLAGRWDLSEADKGDGVVVRGSLSSKESLLQLGARRRLKAVLERTLDALSTRCLLLAAAGASGPGHKKRLLEIRRIGGELELDLAGEKFTLERVGGGAAP